jgi:glycosyltransferase involved in cell wall biosynthesis
LLFDPEFIGIKVRIIVFIEKLLSRHNSKIITTGQHVINDLVMHKIAPLNKFVSVLPSIREINLIDSNTAKSILALPLETPIITWLGRLESIKAPEIVNQIALKVPDCLFVVFGTGTMYEKLSESAPKNVKYVGWQSSILALSVADLLLFTSKSEGLSNSLMEAVACGIPIVANDTSGNRESTQEFPYAFFCKPNVDDYSISIRKALAMNQKHGLHVSVFNDFPSVISKIYFDTIN